MITQDSNISRTVKGMWEIYVLFLPIIYKSKLLQKTHTHTQLQLNFVGKAFFKRFVCFASIARIRISGLSFSAWHRRGRGQTAVLGWVIATLGFSVHFYVYVYIISVFL